MRAVRIKASRSPYRRAGFSLGSADWVELPSELEAARLLMLMRDPVIVLQALDGDAWKTIPIADRQEYAEDMADWLTFEASGGKLGVAARDAPTAGASADGRRPVDEPPTLAPESRIPLGADPVKPTTVSPKADRKKPAAKAGGKPGR